MCIVNFFHYQLRVILLNNRGINGVRDYLVERNRWKIYKRRSSKKLSHNAVGGW